MQFSRELRERVWSGQITTSIRIWQSPRVKVGNRYSLPPGWIVIESIVELTEEEVTDEMVIESGFESIQAWLAVAKHGPGDRIFMIRFRFEI